MTFKEGLLKARSYIVFILGLIIAFGVVIQLEKMKLADLTKNGETIKSSTNIPQTEPQPLTEREENWAHIAWTYFENNTEPTTGMVNSVDGYTATTMWDTASYLLALIAAERLELISRAQFDQRLDLILTTLTQLPLFEDALPNKSYNTVTAAMVDYRNKPTKEGIGWSAIDIGRLLVPFNIIVWSYPEHTAQIQEVISHWKFDDLLKDGVLYGAAIDKEGKTVYLQEGRLGYEEYAAKSLALMGLDAHRALKYSDFLGWIDIYGIQVPYDLRSPEKYHAHNYVVSEPYILDGLEYGWDEVSRELAFRVYRAQEERYIRTNTLTAVSEDHIDRPPYFVYNTVFTDGKTWNCIAEDGTAAAQFKTISTKAVFGWYVLYGTAYTDKLVDRIKALYDPVRGWYSGQYEIDGQPNKAITCNTNGIILESLCYRKQGRMLRVTKSAERFGADL